MALKKSELYSSLWSSCDELRGGMDASRGLWKKAQKASSALGT
jgi:type I restriction-modification system DNA methylase subunit